MTAAEEITQDTLFALKEWQRIVLMAFLGENDIFVWLLTGFGKSSVEHSLQHIAARHWKMM